MPEKSATSALTSEKNFICRRFIHTYMIKMETSGFSEMSLYFNPYDITIHKTVPMTDIAVTTGTAKSVITIEIALVDRAINDQVSVVINPTSVNY